jgi:hypothetical protein
VRYTDGTGQTFSHEFEVTNTLFPLTKEGFVLDQFALDANGSFDEDTGTFSSGGPGSGGWYYQGGLDLSAYKYLVVQLNQKQQCWATVHIVDDENESDENQAWNDEINDIGFPFNDATELVIDLHSLHNLNGELLDLSHIFRVDIWINGVEGSVSIKRVFLSNDGTTQAYQEPTYVYADNKVMYYGEEVPVLSYSTYGPAIKGLPKLSTTANKASATGSYPITVEKGTITSDQVTCIDGLLYVLKAPLEVGVQDVTITEGDAIPAFTLTYEGFRNGDTESNAFTTKPKATTTATASSKPGTYTITVSGGEAKNYALTYSQGTLTIKEKAGGDSWENIVRNSNLEGNDVSCFYSRENAVEKDEIVPATIVSGAGKDNSRGIVVQSTNNPPEHWNTQFFIRLPQPLPAGTKYRFSFDHKASQEAYVSMESHAEPGEYIWWDFGDMTFTSSWQHYEKEGVVSEEESTDEGKMRTIAFNLADIKTATKYYFDNIVFEIFSTTNIKTVNTDNHGNDAIYNLSGQKLSKPRKGISIIGGKKVIVK